MKKFVAILMATLIFSITSVMSTCFAASYPTVSENYDFGSSFDGTLKGSATALGENNSSYTVGWTKTNITVSKDTVISADGCLKLDGSAKAGSIVRNFGNDSAGEPLANGTYVMELDIYIPDVAAERKITIRSSEGTFHVVTFGTDKKITFINDDASGLSYVTGSWYNVKLVINTVNCFYEVTINGGAYTNQKHSGILDSSYVPIQRMGATVDLGAIAYVDNMAFYDTNPIAPSLSYVEDFERFTTSTAGLDVDQDASTALSVMTSVADATRGTYAQITSSSTTNYDVRKNFSGNLSLGSYSKLLFSADFMFDDYNADRTVYLYGRDEEGTRVSQKSVMFGDNHKIYFGGDDSASESGLTYETDTWYSVKLLLNCTNSTVTFYLNGNKIGTIAIGNGDVKCDYIEAFFIRHKGAGEEESVSYIDNFAAKSPTATTLVCTYPENGAENYVYGDGIFLRYTNIVDTEEMTVLIDGSDAKIDTVSPSATDDCVVVINTKEIEPYKTYTLTVTDVCDIFGNELDDVSVTFTTASQFTIGTPVYSTDNFATTTSSIASADEFKTKINIDINDGETYDICVISAVYSKATNTLYDIDYDWKKDLTDGDEFVCTVSVPRNANDYKVITYIWSDMTNIAPLADTIGLNAE